MNVHASMAKTSVDIQFLLDKLEERADEIDAAVTTLNDDEFEPVYKYQVAQYYCLIYGVKSIEDDIRKAASVATTPLSSTNGSTFDGQIITDNLKLSEFEIETLNDEIEITTPDPDKYTTVATCDTGFYAIYVDRTELKLHVISTELLTREQADREAIMYGITHEIPYNSRDNQDSAMFMELALQQRDERSEAYDAINAWRF